MIQVLFLSGCLYRRKSAIFFQRGQCSRPYSICCHISSVNYDNKMITRLPWSNKRQKAIPFPFTTSCSGVFGSVRPLRIDTTGAVWMIHDPTTDRIGDRREPPPALDILPHAPGSSSGPSRLQKFIKIHTLHCACFLTHTVHVWYIYLALKVDFDDNCREMYHTWMLWVTYQLLSHLSNGASRHNNCM